MTDTASTGEAQATDTQAQAVAQTTETATTETATTQATEQTAQSVQDWRESIKDPKVKEFASTFTSPADAATAALQFRQKLSNAISIPGKDAKPEEIAEFHKKLGVPESPDGYELKPPDDLVPAGQEAVFSEGMKPFAEAMHKAGATKEAVQAALDYYYSDLRNSHARAQKIAEESFTKSQEALKQEWGADFDANSNFAQRAVKSLGDNEFIEMQGMTFTELAQKHGNRRLGDIPAFVRPWAKIGRMTNEGGAQFPEGSQVRTDAETKMNELTTKGYEAMNRGDRAAANRYYSERDTLAKSLFPEPAV